MVTIQGKPKLNLDYKGLDQRWVKYKKITPRVQLCSNSFCIFLVLWDNSDEFFMPVFICTLWWLGWLHRWIWLEMKLGCFLYHSAPGSLLWASQRRCQALLWSCECSSILAGCHIQHRAGGHNWTALHQTRMVFPWFNKISKHHIKKKNQVLTVCTNFDHIIILRASLRLCIMKYPLIFFLKTTD